ncbi:MAG: LacI family transcriptional regulator [Gaiellales bacterium]|jgi:LacI family transcriptional regulator|nr:LacI family transcriptional regulator [Gaiellales bacterium]
MPSRPTMIDVARIADVSLKTVSRVVNGEPNVRPETEERVQLAILELGFRRNDAARSLRQRHVPRSLGLVIGDVGNPFYSAIARGVEQVLRSREMLLITGSSDEVPERERSLIRSLLERRVDGLIVAPAATDHRYLLPDMAHGVPIVFIDRPPGRIEADTILLDNAGGVRAAVEHLLELGHERIGFIGDLPAIFTAGERLRGYRAALIAHGVAEDPAIVHLGSHNAESAALALRELLELPEPPTAMLTGNNRITIGALTELARSHAALALVGFDDLELANLLARPLTAVAYDAEEVGRRAAALVVRRLDGDDGPPEQLIEPTSLVVRASSGPRIG